MNNINIEPEVFDILQRIANAETQAEVENILKSVDPQLLKEYLDVMNKDAKPVAQPLVSTIIDVNALAGKEVEGRKAFSGSVDPKFMQTKRQESINNVLVAISDSPVLIGAPIAPLGYGLWFTSPYRDIPVAPSTIAYRKESIESYYAGYLAAHNHAKEKAYKIKFEWVESPSEHHNCLCYSLYAFVSPEPTNTSLAARAARGDDDGDEDGAIDPPKPPPPPPPYL